MKKCEACQQTLISYEGYCSHCVTLAADGLKQLTGIKASTYLIRMTAEGIEQLVQWAIKAGYVWVGCHKVPKAQG